MPILRGILTTLLLALSVAGQQAPAGGPPEALAARSRQTLAEARCQTALPDAPQPGPRREADPEPDPEPTTAPRKKAPMERSAPLPRGLSAPSGLADVLLWSVLALAVLALLATIVRGWRSRGEGAAKVPARRAEPTIAAATKEPTLPDHAGLAARGEFAAAIHALLRHAFAAFGRRSGALPVHATGREVLRRARAEPLPAEDLAQLVQAVEVLHFGGRAAERRHYDDSLRSFAAWEAACRNPK